MEESEQVAPFMTSDSQMVTINLHDRVVLDVALFVRLLAIAAAEQWVADPPDQTLSSNGV